MSSENRDLNTGNSKLLSQEGNARRAAMRHELQTEFERVHAGRRRTRSALAWIPAIILLIAATTWWVWRVESSINPVTQVAEKQRPPTADSLAPQPGVAVAPVTNSHIEFELINDDQLLDLLAEAGQASALAWFKGKPVVVPLGNNSTL